MIPGAYDLYLTENSDNAESFAISGIPGLDGYSAAISIRNGARATDERLVHITADAFSGTFLPDESTPTGGSSLVVGYDGDSASLVVDMIITNDDVERIAALVQGSLTWSLKITDSNGSPLQYLKGKVIIVRTPTI